MAAKIFSSRMLMLGLLVGAFVLQPTEPVFAQAHGGPGGGPGGGGPPGGGMPGGGMPGGSMPSGGFSPGFGGPAFPQMPSQARDDFGQGRPDR